MTKEYDVIALGELLIDMAPGEMSEQGNLTFEACPGGAPCNVLALLAKANHKAGFIGKVGDDFLGKMLGETIASVGIDATGLVYDRNAKTTLAFVHKQANGDRDFSFYRKPGADMLLEQSDIDPEYIKRAKIFHFGTLSMTDDKVREATQYAVSIAKDSDCVISFDPNLREPLWDSLELAKEMMLWGMGQCDILKISDNEVEFLTGLSDMEQGMREIQKMTSAKVILVTLGKDGSLGYAGGEILRAEGVRVANVVDTTGAGDTFMGTSLHYILSHGSFEKCNTNNVKNEVLSETELAELLALANQTAAQITTKKGALKVMPKL